MDRKKETKPKYKPEEDTPAPMNDIGDIHGDNEPEYHLKDINTVKPLLREEYYYSPIIQGQDARFKHIRSYNLFLEVMTEIDKSLDSLPGETRRTVINELCILEQGVKKEKLHKKDLLEMKSVLRKLLVTFDNSSRIILTILDLYELLVLFQQDID